MNGRWCGALMALVVGVLWIGAGCGKQPAEKGANSAQVARGKAIFEDQCALCHDPATAEKKIGPGLKGLFQREKMENGKPLTEASIRENLDKGSDSMPAFKDTLTAEEKDAVIAYLKTL